MNFTQDHKQLRITVRRWIAKQVNPRVEQCGADQIVLAHQLLKQMDDLGLLGLCQSVDDGGLGLDHSSAAVLAETLADINSGGISMATGVQTDMTTLAMAHQGSVELRVFPGRPEWSARPPSTYFPETYRPCPQPPRSPKS